MSERETAALREAGEMINASTAADQKAITAICAAFAAGKAIGEKTPAA